MLTTSPSTTPSTGRFIPSSRRNPCPVCDDSKGKCRTVPESDLVLCMNFGEDLPGWHYLGQTRDDLWGKFFPSDGFKSEVPHISLSDRLPLPEKRIVADQEKDKNYREILQQISLSDRHREDFKRRNLQQPEIQFLETIARSLPNGYLIPFPNAEGHFAGAQTRRDEADGGRYRWHYYRYDVSLDNLFGEKPLAVWQLGNSPTPWIIEGTGVKPIVASIRHGITAIGAAGGQHYLSAKTLIDTLEKLGNPDQVVFCPDAGDLHNPQVLRRIEQNIAFLESLGLQVTIAWWNQDTKDQPDIDEIPNLDGVRYLSPREFWAIVPEQETRESHPLHSFAQWVTWATGQASTSKPEPQGFGVQGLGNREQVLGNSPPPSHLLTYRPGDRLQTWQDLAEKGIKHILDISGTGSGKSYDTGNLKPKDFDSKQAFYISPEHRNPTVETLKDGWYDLEARHGGLSKETTPDGEKRWRRVKPGDVPVTPANCSRSHLIHELRSKTLDADQANLVCSTCPLYELCCNKEGPGYGYLKQRRTSLARERLRLHGLSLPPVGSFDYKAITLVWDEAAVGLLHRQDLKVYEQDILETIAWLVTKNALSPEIQQLLVTLRELLADKSRLGRFGLNHLEIVSQLPEVSYNPEQLETAFNPAEVFKPLNPVVHGQVAVADLPMAQRQFYASDTKDVGKIPKLWLLPFLAILDGKYPGATLRVDHGGLMLSLPDDRHAQVAQAAKVNIYLDATLNREDLALALGIAPEEIAVVGQAQPETPNLSLIQVPDLGRLGRQRGADQERRITALIAEIKKKPGLTKVIDFKDQNQDGAHFVDSRGVNFFQDVTHLAIVGTPCANLMDLQSTYSAMNKTFVSLEDKGFKAWVQRKIEAELIQEIGRLRAHRRLGESLTCYILNDFEFENITVQQVESKTFTIEAAPKLERTRYRILKAAQDLIDQGMDLSQRSLAAVIGMSRTHISDVIRELYGSWEAFKKGWSVLLLDTFIAKPATADPPELDPDLEETAGAILQGLVADPPSETPKTIVSLAEILGWQGLQRVIQRLCQDDRSRLGVNFLAPLKQIS